MLEKVAAIVALASTSVVTLSKAFTSSVSRATATGGSDFIYLLDYRIVRGFVGFDALSRWPNFKSICDDCERCLRRLWLFPLCLRFVLDDTDTYGIQL